MIFAPACVGKTTLPRETLARDKKSCRRFGSCGVGEEALYLGEFLIDRRCYIAMSAVERVFKRVALSKGGFTGKGVFGSVPYLVVEYDGGKQKQCSFKREDDVDALLACMAERFPDIPRMSAESEKRLAEKLAREEARYLKELTPQAQKAREELEAAEKFLNGYPVLTERLSAAAMAKRVNEKANPAYKWVALAIVLAGVAAAAYGIYARVNGDTTGLYFLLMGLAAIFLFSGSQVLPTAKNNRRALDRAWQEAQEKLADVLPKAFPLPARYAHPVVLRRMTRILREGRAQSADEAFAVLKADLKALNADVQVEQEEYDEVVAIKPMFLLCEYR